MVSIIIPVHNGQSFLEKTIYSCINQTYRDIEIIVADDCSHDKSLEIASSIAEFDNRVRVVHNSENAGFCKNTNLGLSIAKGEFVLVLGQDDLLRVDHLEKVLNCFTDDIAVVYCYYTYIDENDVEFKNVRKQYKEIHAEDLLYNNAVPSCGALIRRISLVAVGGYPIFDKYPNYGEWYLWIKLLTQGRIILCEDADPLYRRHKNNISNTFIDPSKMISLNHYWNKCRLLAANQCKYSFFCLFKAILYIIFTETKTVIQYLKYKLRKLLTEMRDKNDNA